MDIVCIIDIKNMQEEYSAALEFIKVINEIQSNQSAELKNMILEIVNKISISVGTIQNRCAPRYFEEPISLSGRGNLSSQSIQKRHSFTEKDVYALRGKDMQLKFHVRVHLITENCSDGVQEDELNHLQYLALFLKKISCFFPSEEKKYVSVFIVPLTGSEYPFCDQNDNIDYTTYTYISKYLRLLSKRYTGVIYGVKEEKSRPVVKSLDFG